MRISAFSCQAGAQRDHCSCPGAAVQQHFPGPATELSPPWGSQAAQRQHRRAVPFWRAPCSPAGHPGNQLNGPEGTWALCSHRHISTAGSKGSRPGRAPASPKPASSKPLLCLRNPMVATRTAQAPGDGREMSQCSCQGTAGTQRLMEIRGLSFLPWALAAAGALHSRAPVG